MGCKTFSVVRKLGGFLVKLSSEVLLPSGAGLGQDLPTYIFITKMTTEQLLASDSLV